MITTKLKFVGKNGSFGYQKNRLYTIRVWHNDTTIMVEKITGGEACPYNNIEAFLANWGQYECTHKSIRY